MLYLSREAWGARTDIPRLGNPVPRQHRTHVIVHHTVIGDPDSTPHLWETLDEVRLKMRQLQTIRPDLGLDVPYNFVIFLMADGSIVVCEGRGYELDGAHTYGHNTTGVGVAFQGNFELPFDIRPFQPETNVFLSILKATMPNLVAINKHQDFSQTDCPGKSIIDVFSGFAFIEPNEDEEMTPEEKANIDRMDKQIQELLVYHNQPQTHPMLPSVKDGIDLHRDQIAELRALIAELSISPPTLSLREIAGGLKIEAK